VRKKYEALAEAEREAQPAKQGQAAEEE